MKISEHARERWRERFNPEAGDVDGEIREAFAKAVEIFREDGERTVSYAVKDNILFVRDAEEDVMVTVVDIVFGFEPGIDREICRMQLKRIEEMKEAIANLEDFCRTEGEGLDSDIFVVEEEIKKLKAELTAMEARKARFLCQKEVWSRELEAKKAEYLKEVNKLRYSINYRLEMMKEKKGGSGNGKKGNKSV